MGIRRSYSGFDFMRSPKEGDIIGVSLGYDFCSEHEHGIRQLQEDFGLKINKKYGFEARKNNIVPPGLFCSNNMLVYPKSQLEFIIKEELLSIGHGEIASAWCEHSFAVSVVPKYSGALVSLYDAFKGKNGVIMLSGRTNPFANSGLILLNYRLIPKEMKDEFYEKDKKYHAEQRMFRKLEQESGIFELLKDNGKEFWSLHIGRLDENGEPSWWLNARGNFGWYKTEDLRQWAENKGPVMKSK